MESPCRKAGGQTAGAVTTSSLASDRLLAELPPTKQRCRLVRWTPWPFENPALIGHCSVAFTGGWCVHSIPVFRRGDGSLSVGAPDIPVLDREGRIRLRPDGKRHYTKLLTFETAEARERWSALLGALAAGDIQ